MTKQEITAEAIRSGLLTPHTKTPAATMGAALYVYLKAGGKEFIRLHDPGSGRALRGSVRWALAPDVRKM